MIIVASIDQHTASLAEREPFSFTENEVRKALEKISKIAGIDGAVLLSTCNRTELYLSGKSCDATAILCSIRNIDGNLLEQYQDEAAVHHLMKVACGLCSQILCEDQIITQVKTSALLARQEKTMDPILETLFRLAITAAKRAKTEVPLRMIPRSSAEQAVRLLRSVYGSLSGKRVLVIGNGEIGRLCANLLRDEGCFVTITLHTYKHGETIVPYGCETIAYDKRSEQIFLSDFIVSATTSPHYTVTKEMADRLEKHPSCFVDLAVPRDIDPCIEDIEGVVCYDMDRIGGTDTSEKRELLQQIEIIMQEYEGQFQQWLAIHNSGNTIQKIKEHMINKLRNSFDEEDPDILVELAVSKTVDSIIYAAKEELSEQLINVIEQNLKP